MQNSLNTGENTLNIPLPSTAPPPTIQTKQKPVIKEALSKTK